MSELTKIEGKKPGLWQDTKFRWLIASVSLVAVFEFLSLLSEDYKLRRELALPFFAAIILAVGWHTLWNGIKSVVKNKLSEH